MFVFADTTSEIHSPQWLANQITVFFNVDNWPPLLDHCECCRFTPGAQDWTDGVDEYLELASWDRDQEGRAAFEERITARRASGEPFIRSGLSPCFISIPLSEIRRHESNTLTTTERNEFEKTVATRVLAELDGVIDRDEISGLYLEPYGPRLRSRLFGIVIFNNSAGSTRRVVDISCDLRNGMKVNEVSIGRDVDEGDFTRSLTVDLSQRLTGP
ncbi:MAG: hypothetical protein H6509_06975 [Bryobacterales bacterium]|nr:hypothetical protein [Bryobacterales bacterium]